MTSHLLKSDAMFKWYTQKKILEVSLNENFILPVLFVQKSYFRVLEI